VRQQCEEHHSEQYQNFKPDERAVIPLAQGRTALLDRKILQDQQILDLRKSLRRNMETMRAARIYGSTSRLFSKRSKHPKSLRVKFWQKSERPVCERYFKDSLQLAFPAIPGHEIAGSVEKIGTQVPPTANLAEGDQVVVVGDGVMAFAANAGSETSKSAGMGSGPDLELMVVMVNSFPFPTSTLFVSTGNII
jgi:alcohol dehydrogenase-like protein